MKEKVFTDIECNPHLMKKSLQRLTFYSIASGKSILNVNKKIN